MRYTSIILGEQKAKISKSKTFKVIEYKPGVYTKFKPHLQADKVS